MTLIRRADAISPIFMISRGMSLTLSKDEKQRDVVCESVDSSLIAVALSTLLSTFSVKVVYQR